MNKPIQSPKFVRSFGRIKSRKLSDHKKHLFSDLLPNYQISEQSIAELKNNQGKIYLEIGFGFGDFLFENAKNNPDILFIGCEPHINGVVNLLAKLEIEPLKNIRIFVGDNRLLLEQAVDKIFEKIYILFPDPWPKSKHHKRRLINTQFLELLHAKTTANAELIIATDADGYKEWIMKEYLASRLWNWEVNCAADWKNFPADWVKTKYQKKAEIAGRENVFLRFARKNS
ncbi:MAG: tRNA ((7)-)-methyltransferase [Rickettsiaceae bacterium]|nr:tRNA ((7)-)-methyltransferase [Rickettsiaceae bacterium]